MSKDPRLTDICCDRQDIEPFIKECFGYLFGKISALRYSFLVILCADPLDRLCYFVASKEPMHLKKIQKLESEFRTFLLRRDKNLENCGTCHHWTAYDDNEVDNTEVLGRCGFHDIDIFEFSACEKWDCTVTIEKATLQ